MLNRYSGKPRINLCERVEVPSCFEAVHVIPHLHLEASIPERRDREINLAVVEILEDAHIQPSPLLNSTAPNARLMIMETMMRGRMVASDVRKPPRFGLTAHTVAFWRSSCEGLVP